jgi:formylglycine-generating enzyme required for sulfatase activity/serine/threonine protein kinase
MPLRFGPFEVLEKPDAPGQPWMLGRGGMGTTYKARDTRIDRFVALKTIRLDTLDDSAGTGIKRFEAETRMLARLNHPNIAVFLESGRHEGSWYYAMEFIPGQDLERVVKQDGPLPVADALDVVLQAGQALAELARNSLIHRDIKPGNLMAVPLAGGRRAIKLIDFGISKNSSADSDSSLTMQSTSGLIPFSADTCSPEQAEGRTDLDIRSDIFSLGATLWYLLLGQYPYHAGDSSIRRIASRIYEEPPWRELSGLPAPVVALLRRMLARQREQRPATADDLVRETQAALNALLAAPTPTAHARPPEVEVTSEPTQRVAPSVPAPPAPPSRGPVLAIGTLLVTFALGGSWLWHRAQLPPAPAEAPPSVATPETPPPTPEPVPPAPAMPEVAAPTPPEAPPPAPPVPPPPPTPDPAQLALARRATEAVAQLTQALTLADGLDAWTEGERSALAEARRAAETAEADRRVERWEDTLQSVNLALARLQGAVTGRQARLAAELTAWTPVYTQLTAQVVASLAPAAHRRGEEALTVARERLAAESHRGQDAALRDVQTAFQRAETVAARVASGRARLAAWRAEAARKPAAEVEPVLSSWKPLMDSAAALAIGEANLDEALGALEHLEKRGREVLALAVELRQERDMQVQRAELEATERARRRREEALLVAAARTNLLPRLRQAVVLGDPGSALATEATRTLSALRAASAPEAPPLVEALTALQARLGRPPQPLDEGALNLAPGVVIELVYLPPGTFTLGTSPGDQARLLETVTPAQRRYWEGRLKIDNYPAYLKVLLGFEAPRKVTLTRGFWIARHETTQAAWQAVTGANPSRFASAGPSAPVENVSWEDGRAFLAALHRRLGTAAVRLPTEAEWEYACRAGTDTDTPAGPLVILGANHSPTLDPIAWYGGNSRFDFPGEAFDATAEPEKQFSFSRAGTHPVGAKRANAWGLHDMIGGVAEWCSDWFDPTWKAPERDPAGPTAGQFRVMRGGSWADQAVYCRSASRTGVPPTSRSFTFGLRLAVEAAVSPP